MRMDLRDASALAKPILSKSTNTMLLHTSEFQCMLDVLYVGRGKDKKGKKALTSPTFTKKVTNKESSPKLN